MIDPNLIGDELPAAGREPVLPPITIDMDTPYRVKAACDFLPSEEFPLPPRGQDFIRNYQFALLTCSALRHRLVDALSALQGHGVTVDQVIVNVEEIDRLKLEPPYFAVGDKGECVTRWES